MPPGTCPVAYWLEDVRFEGVDGALLLSGMLSQDGFSELT